MTHGLYSVVQSMGHGHCTVLHGPWVMGLCHDVWPMGHGKKIAEWALDGPGDVRSSPG